MKRRKHEETRIQNAILAAIGSEPDFLLFRNSVGHAQYTTEDGKVFHVPYGLGGDGAPDLVGFLAPSGRGVAFEVKTPTGVVEPHQEKLHEVWRRFGVSVHVVRSVEDARAALRAARERDGHGKV